MLDERYEQAVCQALEQDYDIIFPMQMHTMQEHTMQTHTITITFHQERHADFVARMDGITRVSDCCVSLTKPSYEEAYKYMRFAIKISNAFA